MTQATLGRSLGEGGFSLTLSSGFFGFYAHTGVVLALEAAGLRPDRMSGSSAGALIAGLWASGVSAPRIRDELLTLRREDFWDPRPGVGLLRGQRFGERLARMLPVSTFEACRTRLSVSVFDVFERQTRIIDRGDLVSAIVASCSFPLLFQPTWRNGRPLLDGGIMDRPGLAGMPHGGRVLYHHLASRSPWRRSNSRALDIPTRPGLVPLVLEGLPRAGPFKLHVGRRALELAHQQTRAALAAAAPAGL